MKNTPFTTFSQRFFSIVVLMVSFFSAYAQHGKIARDIQSLQQKGTFKETVALFEPASSAAREANQKLQASISEFTLVQLLPVENLLRDKPDFIRVTVPGINHRQVSTLLLYKHDISSNGFNLLTSDGKKYQQSTITHYRGSIENDPNSLAAISISDGNISGIVGTNEGNFVIGKLENDPANTHIIYNDKLLMGRPPMDCGTRTDIPLSPGNYFKTEMSSASLTAKCVNWYWETDYDIFTNKGSVNNVNVFMQGVFNQVAALYANDGISITLKTLFVWTSTDPYTGPSTGNYLDQFGVSRTSFDGDMATLIGFGGGGGIAWINTLCNSQTKYRMAYAGISSSYNNVPAYSWTVEVIAHEQGHNLGSRHTHDCAWNGNNTKIDGCGDAAGYTSGTCAIPSPALPVGGGTIMSYCHLTSAGINFNLGFGVQPTNLIINNINNAACLTTCSSGCPLPGNPGAINGSANPCTGSVQTYNIAAVSGATGYVWTLPSGWTGSSTTNSISVTVGSGSGSIAVAPSNSCGNGTTVNLPVTASIVPARPGIITGNIAVCTGIAQTYTITAVAGATSYSWVLPSGWTGSSTTNTITVVPGTTGGVMSVTAVNACGSSQERTKAVTITNTAPAQPGTISGNATVCQGSAQSYSITAVPNATSYVWTFPSAWTAPTVSNVVNVTAGLYSGTISVSAVNGCGTSVKRTFSVTVNPLPVRPAVITVGGGTAAVCPGNTRTYSIPAVAGALSYTWTTPTGGTITSGQGSTSINVTYNNNFIANGTVSVKANNACGAGTARTLTIPRNVPSSPASISGPTTICSGATGSYTTPLVTGATSYTWTIPAGATVIGSATGNTISIRWGSTGGTLSVKANNTCGSSG